MNYLSKEERSSSPQRKVSLRTGRSTERDLAENGPEETTYGTGHRDEPPSLQDESSVRSSKAPKRRYALFGAVLLAVSMAGMTFVSSTSVTTSDEATAALESGVSETLPVGVRIASKDDDTSIEPGDHTVEGTADDSTTKLYVWDYAGEDGDYVQVLVDGEPISEEFMILHKPREFDLPSNGSVQIKGIHDAGGGLTYAAHYDLNGVTYFNNAPEGELNTYTLVGN